MNSSVGVCADCGDSPLSIASNVLGIFTFAIAVLASSLAFIVVTGSADRELENLADTLEQNRKHIDQINEYFTLLRLRADQDLHKRDDLIQASLDSFRESRNELHEKMEDIKRCGVLTRRFWWWYEEKDIATGLAKLDSHKQHFTAIQLTFLLSKMKAQGDDLELLKRQVGVPP